MRNTTLRLPVTCLLMLTICGCAAQDRGPTAVSLAEGEAQLVEAGCGTCIFHMPDVEGCPLAVRIDGKPYLVQGSDIDDHGDAHADDGLCNAARQARVAGHIEDDVFVATQFELIGGDSE